MPVWPLDLIFRNEEKENKIGLKFESKTNAYAVSDNLKYSKDHEWIRVEGDEAYVGITAFAAGELGDIVFVDVDTEGESLDKDEVFGSVEAVKTVSDLFLPVSGEVLEFNEALEDALNLLMTILTATDGW